MSASSERWQDEQRSHESSQEKSGVFLSFLRPIMDVAVGELYSLGVRGEPTPVYATPYLRDGKRRIRCMPDFYLGTRFPMGIIVAEGWEEEMSDACVPEGLIAKCRAYLAERTL